MTTSDEDAVYRAELLATKVARLQTLNLQAARYGFECPAHITTEINVLQKEIAALKVRIEPAIDQVKHPFVRGFLERAAEYYQSANYAEAAGESLGGLLWALRMVRPALLGYARPSDRDAETAQQLMLFQILHLDYTAYFRLSNQVGVIKLMEDSTNIVIQRVGTKVDVEAMLEIGPELANQALAFAMRAIVSIETQAGDLGRPFGRRGVNVPSE